MEGTMSVGKLRQGQAQPQGQWISPATRLALYLRDGFICLYCGMFLHAAEPSFVTLDHLMPRSQGGTNDAHNLITACKSCNCARGHRPWRRFASTEAIIRITNAKRRKLNRRLARAIVRGEAGHPSVEAQDETSEAYRLYEETGDERLRTVM
jgi:hypothetical protein